ncbi:hypothetical protein FJ930_11850 [Mesorhizobium sp. B2-4-15]|uniref:hypothetical protein n=1 Tax=Mesorhizobium sp. B2-4-15 TaxID=2589934 RepID=UPI00114EA77D|nr:hypothetical protein [Mesorhizobium sp. B2-4-15]TPK72446.1 hypothetical protein FJ930_11850 [Mesorhizobium sp. B2-4-15]
MVAFSDLPKGHWDCHAGWHQWFLRCLTGFSRFENIIQQTEYWLTRLYATRDTGEMLQLSPAFCACANPHKMTPPISSP